VQARAIRATMSAYSTRSCPVSSEHNRRIERYSFNKLSLLFPSALFVRESIH
jgi:hypothetical protein